MMKTHLLVLLAALAPSAAFAVSPYKVYWNFTGGNDGNMPYGDPLVLIGTNAGVYGTTAMGGANNLGVVYRIEPYGSGPKETTLWAFTGGADGSLPVAGLIADRNGNLFGTAAMDGSGYNGTVFEISPPATSTGAWTESTLWSFTGGADGGEPVAKLLADTSANGVIYGTTRFGGAYNLGTIFKLTPPSSGSGAWTETVIWSFTGGADGAKPTAELMQANKGVLYGTALEGGSGKAGVAFALTPPSGGAGAWQLTTIWAFSGGTDGANPASALRADASGNLYGTAEYGGTGTCPQASWPYYSWPYSWTNYALNAAYVTAGGNACGLVYELSPPSTSGGPWTQTVLFQFTGDNRGANPFAPVLLNGNGSITGTAPINNFVYPKTIPPLNLFTGDIFDLTPSATTSGSYDAGSYYAFSSKTHGFRAAGGVSVSSNGKILYGATTYGGSSWTHLEDTSQGVLYGFSPPSP